MRASRGADLLLAIGSSLQVYPVAGMVPTAKEHGAQMIRLNAEPTPYDDLADVVLREAIGKVLPSICAGVE